MNQRRRAFCDAYIQSGNATEAARAAGYSERTARSIAQRMLTYVDIQEYIAQRNEEISAASIAGAKEIREFWTSILRDRDAPNVDRIRASELLAKAKGVFAPERYALTVESDKAIREAVHELTLDEARAKLQAIRSKRDEE